MRVHRRNEGQYSPVFPGAIPGVTMILSSPSILRWELNVALIVPDKSSNGAALSVGVIGAGSSGSSDASDNVKVPYIGVDESVILAPNATHDKLKTLAGDSSKLMVWVLVSSTELGLEG